MFFSPKKIQEVRDLQAQKEDQKVQEDAWKAENKRQRAVAKEEKQRGIERRKQERITAKEKREHKQAAKQAASK